MLSCTSSFLFLWLTFSIMGKGVLLGVCSRVVLLYIFQRPVSARLVLFFQSCSLVVCPGALFPPLLAVRATIYRVCQVLRIFQCVCLVTSFLCCVDDRGVMLWHDKSLTTNLVYTFNICLSTQCRSRGGRYDFVWCGQVYICELPYFSWRFFSRLSTSTTYSRGFCGRNDQPIFRMIRC